MKKVLFIGCGNMGSSIAKALNGHELYFYSKSGLSSKKLAIELNANFVDQLSLEVIKKVDLIYLALKPQQFNVLLLENPILSNSNKIFISIMSALTIDFLTKKLNTNNIIRFMPNTPIVLKKGCSIILFSNAFNKTQKDELRTFFSPISFNVEVDSDEKLDQLTTLSGCGPAYIFEIANNLQTHFVKLGFNESDINNMIKHTFLGSSELMMKSTENFSKLTDQVTSKGGMTIKALESFRLDNLAQVLSKAMTAAYDRSQEILKTML